MEPRKKSGKNTVLKLLASKLDDLQSCPEDGTAAETGAEIRRSLKRMGITISSRRSRNK